MIARPKNLAYRAFCHSLSDVGAGRRKADRVFAIPRSSSAKLSHIAARLRHSLATAGSSPAISR